MALIHKIGALAIGGVSLAISTATVSYGMRATERENANPWGSLGWEDEKMTIITEAESKAFWNR